SLSEPLFSTRSSALTTRPRGSCCGKLGCRSPRMLRLLHMKSADGNTLSSPPADSGTRVLPGAEECTWLSPSHSDKCMPLATSTAKAKRREVNDSEEKGLETSRRIFLKAISAVPLTALTRGWGFAAPSATVPVPARKDQSAEKTKPTDNRKFVAIQIG